LIDVVDPAGVEGADAAPDAVDLVAFVKKKLGQVRTTLPGDAGEQCSFHEIILPFFSILYACILSQNFNRISSLSLSWFPNREVGRIKSQRPDSAIRRGRKGQNHYSLTLRSTGSRL
jgi:hypothetical protein